MPFNLFHLDSAKHNSSVFMSKLEKIEEACEKASSTAAASLVTVIGCMEECPYEQRGFANLYSYFKDDGKSPPMIESFNSQYNQRRRSKSLINLNCGGKSILPNVPEKEQRFKRKWA